LVFEGTPQAVYAVLSEAAEKTATELRYVEAPQE
jgi:hypothetical protein